MRLADLQPKWITLAHWASPDPFYVGVSFSCPSHRTPCQTCGHDPAHRLAVRFWPPIDPTDWLSRMTPPVPEGHQRVSGETFETLTLNPSVGLDPCWHGHIVNGELS